MSEEFITLIGREYDGRMVFLLFFNGCDSFLTDYSHDFLDSPLPTVGNFSILNDTEEVMRIAPDSWSRFSIWIMKPFFSLHPLVHSASNLGIWVSLSMYDGKEGGVTHSTLHLDINNKWVKALDHPRIFSSFREGVEFIMDSAPTLIEWVVRDLGIE